MLHSLGYKNHGLLRTLVASFILLNNVTSNINFEWLHPNHGGIHFRTGNIKIKVNICHANKIVIIVFFFLCTLSYIHMIISFVCVSVSVYLYASTLFPELANFVPDDQVNEMWTKTERKRVYVQQIKARRHYLASCYRLAFLILHTAWIGEKKNERGRGRPDTKKRYTWEG